MGNIISIDVGIVLVSITIFDRKNLIFPKKIVETGKAKSLLVDDSYFEVDQSFYSTKHGGTFHFAHFNIHFFKSFLESNAFEAIIQLVDENVDKQEGMTNVLLRKLSALKMLTEEPVSPVISRRNSEVNPDAYCQNEEEEKQEEKKEEEDPSTNIGGGFPSLAHLEKIKSKYGVVKDMGRLQLLCTGGYNNNFIDLISSLLNVNIYKIHGYMETIISAIDFLNSNSND